MGVTYGIIVIIETDLLEKVQLSIARVVSGARKGTSHHCIYEELGWQKLKDRRSAIKLKHFALMMEGKAPSYLCKLIPESLESTMHLRNFGNIRNVKYRTETLKKSFIPSSIAIWNELDRCNRNSSYAKNLLKRNYNILFGAGERFVNIQHAQLRMNCSKLNADLFALHVVNSPACSCGFNYEDVNHYLLNCPLYVYERNKMLLEIRDLKINNVTTEILLRGYSKDFETNRKLFSSVHNYISKTNRL